MTTIQLYDTTLRDGMQGEGMSLSAEEKLRVAHRLDELGIHLIEAGFPTSNPKELELFELLSRETFSHRGDRRLRHDAPPRPARRRGSGAARAGRLLRAGRDARRQDVGAAPGEGREGRPRREPADDRGVGRVPRRAGQARRLRRRALLDGWRDDRDYALRCLRAAAEAGAETVVPCDTNGASLPGQIAETIADVVAHLADTRRAGRHAQPQRPRVRRRQLARRRRGRRDARAGHDERLRRALRQRQPRLDRPQPAAQARATSACRPTGSRC